MRAIRSLSAATGLALLVSSSPQPVSAWNDRGHMLVAFIAFRHLHLDVRQEVGRLLALNPDYRSWTSRLPATATPERRALIALQQASIWPDFIKTAPGYIADGAHGGNTPPFGPAAAQNIGYADKNQHRYWHFINLPFSDDGTPTRNPAEVNVQSQIEVMRKALASPATSDDVKSYDLVWLTHLVADVHQPLHVASRFTRRDTDGDKGGNDLPLRCAPALRCETTLHFQWDALLGTHAMSSSIASGAAMLDSGPPPAGAKNGNVAEWIQESLTIARASAYRHKSGATVGDQTATLNADYLHRARAIARQRVRLAGHRLAALINSALGRT